MKAHIEGKKWTVYMKGKSPVSRPNKVAVHYQRKAKITERDLLTLAVHGTLDPLASRRGVLTLCKRIMKEHPIDKGYFKEVHIISEYGKRLLKKHRNATEK